MALRLRPIIARMGRLSSISNSSSAGASLSRTSVRFNQTIAAAAATTATTTTTTAAAAAAATAIPPTAIPTEAPPAAAETTTAPPARPLTAEEKAERKRKKKEAKANKNKQEPTVFPRGHGEKIYIFCHFLNGLTAYSHEPVLKALKALRQTSYNGKKLKPSKLRKDYWRPLAMIQFPEGLGAVGRSIYHRLRECKKLHEFSWDDSIFYDPGTGRQRTLQERGRVLNDQKANAVADMAAVLGGLGKGNKIWVTDPDEAAAAAAAEGKEVSSASVIRVADEDKVEVTKPDGEVASLIKVSIWWADKEDRKYAQSWPKNVTHYLFDEAQLAPLGVGGVGPPESRGVKGEEEHRGEPGQGVEEAETQQAASEEAVAEQEPQKSTTEGTDQKDKAQF
ncbi:transcriptional regulation of mitochondrial recombination-domain-containing protein [Biscogniauxia mediterranea]|nr:transcriptional regulation of mitochondrial recombination-domain-containing protein [Biscogniauxia mediterranea]